MSTAGAAPADPVLAAWGRERDTARRASRIVQTVVMVIAAIITAVGTGNAHDALSHHSTADPWAWMLYPGVEAALIAELQISAHLAEMEARKFGDKREGFDWGFGLRLVTGVSALALNVWYPAERGDISGAGLHSLGPMIQVFVIEALAQFRKRYTRIIVDRTSKIAERQAKIAARSTRAQNPAVPQGVPAAQRQGAPGQPMPPYPAPVQDPGYSSPEAPRTTAGSPPPGTGAGPAGRDGNTVDPETLKAWAIKVDAESRERFNRPASIRVLKKSLGIGQDKATELQTWLAKRPGGRPGPAASGSTGPA